MQLWIRDDSKLRERVWLFWCSFTCSLMPTVSHGCFSRHRVPTSRRSYAALLISRSGPGRHTEFTLIRSTHRLQGALPMNISRRSATASLTAVALGVAGLAFSSMAQAADTIKVGVLHSLSGTMAISETVLKDTVLMAIEIGRAHV